MRCKERKKVKEEVRKQKSIADSGCSTLFFSSPMPLSLTSPFILVSVYAVSKSPHPETLLSLSLSLSLLIKD